ncbi:SRPBCC domain-containing protein [Aquimarina sp. AU58]|uniref:SRPBCC family protein n=1 Tax=Aquimarina sp. AU58 TaxID=1874112 RepID=UPI000D651CB7|nr:SRPBCC domain-containing protein [Aquimarina sp. AU58]
MENKTKLTKEIEINASLPCVWDVVTNPENIKYLFKNNADTDWKTDSQIPFQYEKMHNGVFLEIEANKILKFNNLLGLNDMVSIITYQLDFKKKHTILKVTQQGFENEKIKKHTENNWGIILKRIKEIATVNNK